MSGRLIKPLITKSLLKRNPTSFGRLARRSATDNMSPYWLPTLLAACGLQDPSASPRACCSSGEMMGSAGERFVEAVDARYPGVVSGEKDADTAAGASTNSRLTACAASPTMFDSSSEPAGANAGRA